MLLRKKKETGSDMKIFSFFAGVGMLDLGFQDAGYEIVFVNEFKKEFMDSYCYARRKRNYNQPIYGYHVKDINYYLEDMGEHIFQQYIDNERQNNELIGFIGGPPCPDFSVGGKNKGREGENGKLAKSYIDMICHFRPDFFLFENVKGLIKTQKHREYFEELKRELKQNGYILTEQLMNSLDFGVPQDRERIFMIIITIFNYYFYDFNRAADDITKSILRDEGLLQDDAKKEVKRRKDENSKLLKENQRLLKEIKRTKEILLTKAVVIGDDVNISQKVYEKAIETLDSVDTQIKITQDELGKTKEVLDTAEAGLKEIQIEAFNNYKLMANGLITETMTHELHSIVNDPNMYNIESDFEVLKEFLYDTNIKLYNDNLLPIKDQSDLLLRKVEDVADLYNFLEKTFIKKNNYDEYACENVGAVVGEIERKLKRELSKNKITIIQKNLKTLWYMPKGVLLHVLYNLFTNSIYWIDIREKRALKEKKYCITNNEIVVEQKTESNIWVYDSGLGVLKKMEYILFDALQSGKENDGRGMGLYIVKKLLKSFNADIELLEETNEWGNRYIFSIIRMVQMKLRE